VGSIFVFLPSFFVLGSTDVMKTPEVNNFTVDSRRIWLFVFKVRSVY